MLEQIKEMIAKKYKMEDSKGLFFSVFDEKNTLLLSNWVLETDKPLGQLVELLYHWLVEKQPTAKKIVADIITEQHIEADMQKILGLSAVENWICAINNETKKSGIILPNTAGIATAKDALIAIKAKYQISWNISIIVFKTDRLAMAI